MDKPDRTNKAVAGSGTVVEVTVSVPTGLPVASGRKLTTLPDVDRKTPVSKGPRGNEKEVSREIVCHEERLPYGVP